MRQIGKIQQEEHARQLIAYMLTCEIKALAERADVDWEIWIKNEDDLPRSRELLEEFKKNPDDPKYATAVQTANRLAKEELQRQEKNKQNLISMRSNWSNSSSQRKPMVFTLVVISTIVFLMMRGWEYRGMLGGPASSPPRTVVLNALLFVNPDDALAACYQKVVEEAAPSDGQLRNDRQQILEAVTTPELLKAAESPDIKLLSIMRGEFWRLFTPMFIHFGIIHILFNMMWLNSLGGQFEAKLGTFRFGLFVLTAAVVAQVTQQMMPGNLQGSNALTLAGGMSGVNFALGGFIWAKSRYHPQTGFFLSPVAIFTLLLVLIVGILNQGQSVSLANWAHGAGFAFGLLCGYLPILSPRP